MRLSLPASVVVAATLTAILCADTLSAQSRDFEISGMATAYLNAGNRQSPAPLSALFLIRASPSLDSALASVCAMHHRTLDSLREVRSSTERSLMAAMPRSPSGVVVASNHLRLSELRNTEHSVFQSTFARVKAALRAEVVSSTVTEDDGTFTFEGVSQGHYFIYGNQPKPRVAPMIDGKTLPGWDDETHWWAPVTVGPSKRVRRNVTGDENGSVAYCGAY